MSLRQIALVIAVMCLGCSSNPAATPIARVQNVDQATNLCAKAVIAWANKSSDDNPDGLEDYRPMFNACTRNEWETANQKFTTEWTRAPMGWVVARCREYNEVEELGLTRLCVTWPR